MPDTPPREAGAADVPGALLLDVRRAPAFAAATAMLAGAVWRDPSGVAAWAALLPPDARVIVYCVHGHEVSQGVAQHLCERGIDARFLGGGFEGWRAAGGATVPKPG